MRSAVLIIGGRAGVGKSSVAAEIHLQLSAAGVRHGVIEGDNLDLAYPPPWEHGLAERNLAAMWANYRALNYRRLVYTNTVSVRFIDELTAAMGDDPAVTAVLLGSSDTTAGARLGLREIGTGLAGHVARSAQAARELEALAPAWVHRVGTDGRRVVDIAAELITLTGWLPATDSKRPPPPADDTERPPPQPADTERPSAPTADPKRPPTPAGDTERRATPGRVRPGG